MHRVIAAVCSEIRIQLIKALCGQNADSLDVNLGSTHNNHYAFKRSTTEQSCCQTVKPTMLTQGSLQIKVTVCICQGVHRGIPSTLWILKVMALESWGYFSEGCV